MLHYYRLLLPIRNRQENSRSKPCYIKDVILKWLILHQTNSVDSVSKERHVTQRHVFALPKYWLTQCYTAIAYCSLYAYRLAVRAFVAANLGNLTPM